MIEKKNKTTNHLLIIRAKRKNKSEYYNGIICYNHNLYLIFKYYIL